MRMERSESDTLIFCWPGWICMRFSATTTGILSPYGHRFWIKISRWPNIITTMANGSHTRYCGGSCFVSFLQSLSRRIVYGRLYRVGYDIGSHLFPSDTITTSPDVVIYLVPPLLFDELRPESVQGVDGCWGLPNAVLLIESLFIICQIPVLSICVACSASHGFWVLPRISNDPLWLKNNASGLNKCLFVALTDGSRDASAFS